MNHDDELWVNDLAVLYRGDGVLDFFPMSYHQPNQRANGISRFVLPIVDRCSQTICETGGDRPRASNRGTRLQTHRLRQRRDVGP